jgi:hypothetical protein
MTSQGLSAEEIKLEEGTIEGSVADLLGVAVLAK